MPHAETPRDTYVDYHDQVVRGAQLWVQPDNSCRTPDMRHPGTLFSLVDRFDHPVLWDPNRYNNDTVFIMRWQPGPQNFVLVSSRADDGTESMTGNSSGNGYNGNHGGNGSHSSNGTTGNGYTNGNGHSAWGNGAASNGAYHGGAPTNGSYRQNAKGIAQTAAMRKSGARKDAIHAVVGGASRVPANVTRQPNATGGARRTVNRPSNPAPVNTKPNALPRPSNSGPAKSVNSNGLSLAGRAASAQKSGSVSAGPRQSTDKPAAINKPSLHTQTPTGATTSATRSQRSSQNASPWNAEMVQRAVKTGMNMAANKQLRQQAPVPHVRVAPARTSVAH